MVDIPQDLAVPQNQQPLNDEVQQRPGDNRVRRTHKDHVISSFLSKLSLREKLSTNKEIEEKNKERELKTLKNKQDPTAFPDPGSEVASFVTIDEADIEDLKDPSMFSRFIAVMPDLLIQRITRENRQEKEEKEKKEKRRLDDNQKSSSDDSRVAKRRCMDGDKAAERVVGSQSPIEFSEIMYITDTHTALPLPFFQNKNLRYIIDHAATLPTIKSNPREGESKGSFILDVPKLTVLFGAETSIDFGQWHEAAANSFRFQMSRDKNGNAGTYAQWWSHHFGFFNAQEDKIDMYDAWKHLELKFRREYRTQPTQYDPQYYAAQYELCKSEYRAEKRLKDMFMQMNRSTNARDDNSRGYSNSNRGTRSFVPRSRGIPSSSFQSGSRRSSLPICCLLCAEKGHPVSEHLNGAVPVPTKASDGKPLWAKVINAVLCTPDGRTICINFNIRGSQACSHTTKDERVHLCSFCGSKNHHAFSWTCRTRPSD